MTAEQIAALTPAPFNLHAVASAHAAWTWAFRMDAAHATASLATLDDWQLRDMALAADLFMALIEAERGRRRNALAEAILTPDAVSGGAL